LNNILIRTAEHNAPTIVLAAATQDADGKWVLRARIRPADARGSEKEALSYRIKWLLRKGAAAVPDNPEARTTIAAEEVLPTVSTEQESSLTYALSIEDGEVFELYATPVTADGKSGPSARRLVSPVLTRGEL
jgi:hypothetical protein